MKRLLAVLTIWLATAGGHAHASNRVVITAPYDGSTYSASCDEGQHSSVCATDQQASIDGTIRLGASVESLAGGAAPGAGTGRSSAEIETSYDLAAPAEAVIFTANVLIRSAAATAEGAVSSALGNDRPYPVSVTYPLGYNAADSEAFLFASSDACPCGTEGYFKSIATTYPFGPASRTEETVAFHFTVVNRNGGAVTPGHFSLAFFVEARALLFDAGRADVSADMLLTSIEVEVVE